MYTRLDWVLCKANTWQKPPSSVLASVGTRTMPSRGVSSHSLCSAPRVAELGLRSDRLQ